VVKLESAAVGNVVSVEDEREMKRGMAYVEDVNFRHVRPWQRA